MARDRATLRLIVACGRLSVSGNPFLVLRSSQANNLGFRCHRKKRETALCCLSIRIAPSLRWGGESRQGQCAAGVSLFDSTLNVQLELQCFLWSRVSKLEDFDAASDATVSQQNTATTPAAKMQSKLKKEMAAHAAAALAMVTGDDGKGLAEIVQEKVRWQFPASRL